MRDLLRVARRPGVGRLAAGGLLSETADWMMFIALPLFVLQLTGSPLVTATVFAVQLVPTILVGPVAGVLVDRLDPCRLMATVALGQAAVLLGLLAVQGVGDLWLVFAVVGVQAVLSTVIEPCRAVTTAMLVPPADLATANQLAGVLSALPRLVGGPLGGLVLDWTGIDAVVAVTLCLYALTAVVFVWGAAPSSRFAAVATPAGRQGGPVSRVWQDWRAGLRVVTRTLVLRRAMVVAACMSLAQGAFVVLFVLFVLRDLDGTESDVGLLRGVQAVGALAGGLLLGAVVRRWSPTRLVTAALAAFGVVSLLVWNAPVATTGIGWYVGLFIVAGVPGLAAIMGLLTVLQSATEPSARGRVLSTFQAVSGAAQAVGMLLAGLVGTGVGLTVALQAQGLMYLLAAVLSARIGGAADPPDASTGRGRTTRVRQGTHGHS